jgi:hypothetical protein
MRCRAVIMPDGKLALFIEDGTYEAGKAKLETLLADLGGQPESSSTR